MTENTYSVTYVTFIAAERLESVCLRGGPGPGGLGLGANGSSTVTSSVTWGEAVSLSVLQSQPCKVLAVPAVGR